MKEKDLITRDWLAIDRTKMANERTFLAYMRTFMVILGSGVAILKVEVLEDLSELGFFFIVLAPAIMVFGIIRFLYVRRHIHKYYRESRPSKKE